MSFDLLAAKKKKKRKKDPKYVHEKYKEILENQKEKDEGKAKAVAWSIYCKYKNPESPRCSKKPDEYLTKKAYSSDAEKRKYRKKAKLIGAVLDQLVSKGLLKCYDIIEKESSSQYVENLVSYMWTTGKIPVSLVSLSGEAKALGSVSYRIHAEDKPERLPTKEEKREAHKILRSVFIYIYQDWSTDVWSKVIKIIGDSDLTIISLEMLSSDNKIEYAVEYTSLLEMLYGD